MKHKILIFTIIAAIGYLLYFVIFKVRIIEVANTSLYPLLKPGDIVVTLKSKKVNVGDIVVIDVPWYARENRMIKICKGLPGDLILVQNGKLYRNEFHLQNRFESDYISVIIPNIGDTLNFESESKEFVQELVFKAEGRYDAIKNIKWLSMPEEKKWVVNKQFYFMSSIEPGKGADSLTFGLVTEDQIISKAYLLLWNNRADSGRRWIWLRNRI